MAEAQGAPREKAADFQAVTGKDVRGKAGGHAVALGNAAIVREVGLETGEAKANRQPARRRQDGNFRRHRPIRESGTHAVRELHAQDLRAIMATGDNERTALAVTGRLGIDEVRVALLPKAKKDLIDRLRRDGHKLTMAGDEGNDAPALAAADAIRALVSVHKEVE